MPKPLVVFTDDTIHPAGAERLASRCELRILPGAYPNEARLAEAAADATVIFARMGDVTRNVIAAAPRLRLIARHGIGVDAVDMEAATEHGVMVTTTGSVNAGAVAEYAFALLLGLARKVPDADAGMRRGEWTRNPLVGTELAGKTLGVIGLGAIGGLMARQALGFRMKVIAQDPVAKPPPDLTVEMTTREDLLARSDVISLHLRLTPGTRHTIDARSIAAMKPTAFLVNTSRGELIDEAALTAALTRGALAGAALDVFEQEPLAPGSPLRFLPNVLLSPHVAGQTGESMRAVAIAAADQILEAIEGRTPPNVYNMDALRRAGRI
jgi:D-3-phosphoglycerate dehydrogenase